VTFGSDDTTRIAGKGTLSLLNENTKTKNVLYVDGMKHNILNVSHMCDQGPDLTFNSQVLKKEERIINISGKCI